MSRAQFETWLNGTQLSLGGDGAPAVLRVRSTFARELLETRYRERIQAAIAQVTGRTCTLRVVVDQHGTSADADFSEGDEPVPQGALVAAPESSQRILRTQGGASRAARARYDGPTLFGPAADESAVPTPSRRAVAQPIPRRRAGGATRGTSPTVRVREARGRGSTSIGALRSAAGDAGKTSDEPSSVRATHLGSDERNEL
ncbi:MAG TPA: hypothetical protein VET66_13725, partial [Steroidobacteraceae bacterium]|nr:hypothetical protein [Steroidobacteraceae bacterium]